MSALVYLTNVGYNDSMNFSPPIVMTLMSFKTLLKSSIVKYCCNLDGVADIPSIPCSLIKSANLIGFIDASSSASTIGTPFIMDAKASRKNAMKDAKNAMKDAVVMDSILETSFAIAFIGEFSGVGLM